MASESGVQTIDVASLSSVVDLDGPWRFHAGDDPHFADPAFDDSAWPSIQPSHSAGMPYRTSGYVWTRVHLHVPTGAGPLALAVYRFNGAQYELFVNGSPIASTPGMATRTLRIGSLLPVALPAAGDMVVAIRFYCGFPIHGVPFGRASIGSVSAIQTVAELDHLHILLDYGILANCAFLPVLLLLVVTATILYRAQPGHDEYLWFGALCLCAVLYTVLGDNGVIAGWVPLSLPNLLLGSYAGWLCMVLQLEFVMRFCRTRRRWPIRILQGFMLIGPALNASSFTWSLYMPALLIAEAALTASEIACLVSAYRRGMADAGLLLVPCTVSAAINFAWVAAIFFPAVPWGPNLHFGPVGMTDSFLAALVFTLGIMAVALYRFLRVARDEERAAAELEAALTVQQILVPEEIPTIAGFSIQAVYRPAGQVGGDFYQVLPTSNGGLLAVIGDVSGKGMPAAMTVSLLVGTVRTLAHYTQDPAGILTAMNQRMIGRGNGGFTTALVLRLDPDGNLTAANAGHIAPYANGKELTIDNGLPLGIIAAAPYSNSTLRLEHGTTLTLLTDGVVEAQNAKGELFGFGRTAAISATPAQTIADAAQTFGQQDDITVLSLALVASE